MKNKLLVGLFTVILCFVLTGCGTKITIKPQAELNEAEGVSMTIKEGTLTRTGATIVITDLSGKDYIYGEPFRIDKKINGVWEEVNTISENYGFNLIAYKVDKNNKLELKQGWKSIYGELKNGEYRLVKYTLEGNATENDRKYFSVEFVIE